MEKNYEAALLDQFGGDNDRDECTMHVYRLKPIGKKIVWLFECDPSMAVHALLRDEYGGGTYGGDKFELRVYKNNIIFKRLIIFVTNKG